MKLLKIQIDRKEQEAHALSEELKQVIRDKNIFAARGDLSENQDYKIAKETEKNIVEKLTDIREDLRNSEEISIDSTSVFGLGSLLEVKLFESDGSPVRPLVSGDPVEGEDREFAYTDYLFLLPKGDILSDGVLSLTSALGKEIYNQESPDRTLEGNIGGITYKVRKLGTNDIAPLFLKKHPESTIVIDKLFE